MKGIWSTFIHAELLGKVIVHWALALKDGNIGIGTLGTVSRLPTHTQLAKCLAALLALQSHVQAQVFVRGRYEVFHLINVLQVIWRSWWFAVWCARMAAHLHEPNPLDARLPAADEICDQQL